MRILAVCMTFGLLVACADERHLNEPFGAPLRPQWKTPAWFYTEQEYFRGRGAYEINGILKRVRETEGSALIHSVNNAVNSWGQECSWISIAKCEIFHRLNPAMPCRIVVGQNQAGFPSGHAMTSVWHGGQWHVLDNGHIAAPEKVLRDTDIAKLSGNVWFTPWYSIAYR